MTEPIREVLENLLAGGVGLRMLPCGHGEPECGFGGTLLDRSDYIEPERAALICSLRHRAVSLDCYRVRCAALQSRAERRGSDVRQRLACPSGQHRSRPR